MQLWRKKQSEGRRGVCTDQPDRSSRLPCGLGSRLDLGNRFVFKYRISEIAVVSHLDGWFDIQVETIVLLKGFGITYARNDHRE